MSLMHYPSQKHFQMNNFSSVYEIANDVTEIVFQTKRDLQHFDYYYSSHKTNKKPTISIFFRAEQGKSFIDAMLNRKGLKEIYYKKDDEMFLYESFSEKALKPSIFPPVIFNKNQIAVHSSSFNFKNRAHILMGLPYSGKSTTLLYLCGNNEYEFISDDVTIIDLNSTIVYPFLRPIGLRLNTIEIIDWLKEIEIEDCLILELDGATKVIASPSILPIKICKKPVVLASIFLLKKDDEFNIRNLEIEKAYNTFGKNMHINKITKEKFFNSFKNIKFFEISHNFNNFIEIEKQIKSILQ